MTAIHQFIPTLAPRDAIGTHCFNVQQALRDAGYQSDIYTLETKPEYRRLTRSFSSFGGSTRDGEWILYHSAVGSAVADYVAAREEPLIVDYHNITPSSFFARWEPSVVTLLNKGRRQLERLEARCELGIADSAFNASEMEAVGYQDTAVVPILLDTDALAAADPDPAIKRTGATTWLFVGRLAPNKAQHDLIKALAAYRRFYDADARLVLVGMSSSDTYENALKGFASALGLADAVTFTGPVSPEGLAAYYETADVFVVASEHEGFCVPLLEAMHHRLPIVAYAAAAIPETLADAGLVLVLKDPYTMASAVHQVISDDILRTQLIEAGARRLHDFELERSKRKLLDVIEPVVGRP
jgi:glycosyltransferase involved in cell wall biosynthesis